MVYGNAFYISAVAPVAAIMLANIITLILVTVKLQRSSKHNSMSDTTSVISEARIAFACNVLLGTTWVLAFFAVKDVTMVFQWLFCIANSLQGFFIFLFLFVRDQNVRNAWLKAFGKYTSSKPSKPKTPKNTDSKDKKGKKFHSDIELVFFRKELTGFILLLLTFSIFILTVSTNFKKSVFTVTIFRMYCFAVKFVSCDISFVI